MSGHKRSTPQKPFAIPQRLHDQALAIADLRTERDLIGHGLPVVVRRALHSYVRKHMRQYRDLLPPELRD